MSAVIKLWELILQEKERQEREKENKGNGRSKGNR